MVKNEETEKNEIEYKFIPGPFMRTYLKAITSPEPVLLLIEEINRANVAAVFGDVFQLLDRDEKGKSEYPVAASEDVKKWLDDELKEMGITGISTDKLCIPANMYIWATMNSADQGVYAMDTAFKRRWTFRYRKIDEDDSKVDGWEINGSSQTYMWNKFRKKLNAHLIDKAHVNEDKCLGPFFLKKSDCESKEIFASKVLMYLYEDVVKHNPHKIFKEEYKGFSAIYEAFLGKTEFGVFVADISTDIGPDNKQKEPEEPEGKTAEDDSEPTTEIPTEPAPENTPEEVVEANE